MQYHFGGIVFLSLHLFYDMLLFLSDQPYRHREEPICNIILSMSILIWIIFFQCNPLHLCNNLPDNFDYEVSSSLIE